MIEHFKPAGHKAPTMNAAAALEETFKPIQRVTHNDKTIGYLFRDVDYGNGHIEDVVLANEVFKFKHNIDCVDTIYKPLVLWSGDLANQRINPYAFQIPSAPLMMELTYRAMQDKSELHNQVTNSLRTTYEQFPLFSTIINYPAKIVHHNHLNKEPEKKSFPTLEKPAYPIHLGDMTLTTQAFLSALLGRRAARATIIFSAYGTTAYLLTPLRIHESCKCTLAFGVNSNNHFDIYADLDGINGTRPAIGVAVARNILSMKGVKVHDD